MCPRIKLASVSYMSYLESMRKGLKSGLEISARGILVLRCFHSAFGVFYPINSTYIHRIEEEGIA